MLAHNSGQVSEINAALKKKTLINISTIHAVMSGKTALNTKYIFERVIDVIT